MAFYKLSMRSALIDLYPNMRLSSYKFDRVNKSIQERGKGERRREERDREWKKEERGRRKR
jgi:hypothetical protein